MTAEAANTTVTVLRGSTHNAFGDPAPADVPAYAGVPAVLIETGHSTTDPSNPNPRTVRQIQCHVPYWTCAVNTDRILDERTGDTYMVISVTRPATLIGTTPDFVLQLKRVTGKAA